jgi:hypothetical protein
LKHEHHFPIVTRWHRDERSGMYFQTIVRHEDCECGRSYAEHVCDWRVNVKAAVALVRRRYGGDSGWRDTHSAYFSLNPHDRA